MEKETVEIIMPAYNEEYRLPRTLRDYLVFFGPEVRVTVVVNNTTDRTRQVAEDIAREFPGRVKILEEKGYTGKGGAILMGWEQAEADIIGFVDADGATPAEEFGKLIEAMPGRDAVIASRFLDKSKIIDRESMFRTVSSRVFIWLVKGMFSLPYSDFQCGAKAFRREALEEVLPQVTKKDMTFDVDLLWRANQGGKIVGEVPTVWIEQPGSATLGSTGRFVGTARKMFSSLVSLRMKK